MELKLSEWVTLRQALSDVISYHDEKGNQSRVLQLLEIWDKLETQINELSEQRQLEREADKAWKESTYYEQWKDNPSVEEGWKRNWMKVSAEEEIIDLIKPNQPIGDGIRMEVKLEE